jgi:hypothetical protein
MPKISILAAIILAALSSIGFQGQRPGDPLLMELIAHSRFLFSRAPYRKSASHFSDAL